MEIDSECLKNPLLDKLNTMARELTGIDFENPEDKDGHTIVFFAKAVDRVIPTLASIVGAEMPNDRACRAT